MRHKFFCGVLAIAFASVLAVPAVAQLAPYSQDFEGLDQMSPTALGDDGWLVFANLDRDDPPQVDEGEPIVLAHAPASRIHIRANRDAFTFRPFDLRATNGTVVFCDERGSEHARAVIVSPTGRPRTSPRDASGDALVCPEHSE